jgi:hypothetical protein
VYDRFREGLESNLSADCTHCVLFLGLVIVTILVHDLQKLGS